MEKLAVRSKGRSFVLSPSREGIIKRWEKRARRLNIDVSKWVLGDRLYEEEFSRKWAGRLSRPAQK